MHLHSMYHCRARYKTLSRWVAAQALGRAGGDVWLCAPPSPSLIFWICDACSCEACHTAALPRVWRSTGLVSPRTRFEMMRLSAWSSPDQALVKNVNTLGD